MTSTGVLRYSSNNSGGSWWLSDDDWKALEKDGWDVEWCADTETLAATLADENGRFLGALAISATLSTNDPEDGVESWETVTGEDSTDQGCGCCGSPHSFSFEDKDGNYKYFDTYTEKTGGSWS
jgi:hypothetical protein